MAIDWRDMANNLIKGAFQASSTLVAEFSDQHLAKIIQPADANYIDPRVTSLFAGHYIRDEGDKIRWGEGAYMTMDMADAIADYNEQPHAYELREYADEPEPTL